MSSKIEDNESYSKLKGQVKGLDSILKIYKFTKFFGLKDPNLDKILEQIPNFKTELDKLSKGPDLFNKYFSERGWIAYESMNSPLLDKCVALAEEGKIDEAELEMVAHYKRDETIYSLKGLKSIDEFKVRYDLILNAYEDFREQRYYAMVPIMLMMIDGAVGDVLKSNKSFFAEGADLKVWDSLVGHESGLTNLAKIFGKGRYKTTTEPLTVPYRNGILHGMDLNYANELVATKTLAALFAIKDWAQMIKSGKNAVLPAQEPPLSKYNQFKKSVIEWKAHRSKMDTIYKRLDEWKPRKFDNDEFLPDSFEENSPESELIILLENFRKKNYGAIAQQMDFFPKKNEPVNLVAKTVRQNIGEMELKSFKIIKIRDASSAITDISTILTVNYNGKEITKPIDFRMICQHFDGSVACREEASEERTKWYLMDNLWKIGSIPFG